MILNGLSIALRDEPAEFDSIEGHGRVCILGAHRSVESATVEDAGAFLCALDDATVDRLCVERGIAIVFGYDDEDECKALVGKLFSEGRVREIAQEWMDDQ